MKVLVLAAEPVDAATFRNMIDGGGSDVEVLVVAPALHDSLIRFWLSDDDEAIERAQNVQEETVERLTEAGVDAAGDTGEADPVLAVEDALKTFDADRILIVAHPSGDRAYREDELAERVRERTDVPVEELVVRR